MNQKEHTMNIKDRLAEGAAILERGFGEDPGEREIIDRELRDLEQTFSPIPAR